MKTKKEMLAFVTIIVVGLVFGYFMRNLPIPPDCVYDLDAPACMGQLALNPFIVIGIVAVVIGVFTWLTTRDFRRRRREEKLLDKLIDRDRRLTCDDLVDQATKRGY